MPLTKPGIEDYAESKTEVPSALLDELMRETRERFGSSSNMLTGRIEGSFLRLMVQISGAKHILEVGTFTGYSALSMAQSLPADGTLTTLDIEPKHIEVAKRYFDRAEFGAKISIVQGPALDSIKALSGPFDLVFIDADKTNYLNYYEAILPKVKTGGLILVDNVLWGGAVLNPQTEDDHAIVALNNRVAADARVEKVFLTIRDGVFFIRKK